MLHVDYEGPLTDAVRDFGGILKVKKSSFSDVFNDNRRQGSRTLVEVVKGYYLPCRVARTIEKKEFCDARIGFEVVKDPDIDEADGKGLVMTISKTLDYHLENTYVYRLFLIPSTLIHFPLTE